MVKLKETR